MTENSDKKESNHAVGCLLIHGFGGSTNEVKPLRDYLSERGYRVECPVLKGHTGKRRDMKTCTYLDWVASAQDGYDRLTQKCDKIMIAGFSMGGLIAFQIARQHKIDAIVTLNTPIYYWDLKRMCINIANDFRKRTFVSMRRYLCASVSMPINALINFQILLSRTKAILTEITCPVLITQALEDDTVRKVSAGYIYSRISSADRDIRYYEGSGHLILWSSASQQVMSDIGKFFDLKRGIQYE